MTIRQAWTEGDNLSIVHQVEDLGKRPAKVKVGTHSLKTITTQISRLRAQGLITLRFAKRTKPAENFTTSQIAFIRQYTKEATKGARQSGPEPTFGAPHELFREPNLFVADLIGITYQPSADGSQFLVLLPLGDAPTARPLTVVTNWQSAFGK